MRTSDLAYLILLKNLPDSKLFSRAGST